MFLALSERETALSNHSARSTPSLHAPIGVLLCFFTKTVALLLLGTSGCALKRFLSWPNKPLILGATQWINTRPELLKKILNALNTQDKWASFNQHEHLGGESKKWSTSRTFSLLSYQEGLQSYNCSYSSSIYRRIPIRAVPCDCCVSRLALEGRMGGVCSSVMSLGKGGGQGLESGPFLLKSKSSPSKKKKSRLSLRRQGDAPWKTTRGPTRPVHWALR